MSKKLNEEAINELMHLINEVKEMQSLMGEFGINYASDPDLWVATSFSDDHTGILHWDKEYLSNIDGVESGESFTIGACVTTGSEHTYKGKYTIAPKELAEVQGDIVEEYLTSILHSNNPKHFTLKFDNPYGLYDNCGWEQFMGIEATIEESALKDSKTETIIKNITEQYGYDYIYGANDFACNEHKTELNYRSTKGMVEIFSNLISNMGQNNFGVGSEYLKESLQEYNRMVKKQEEIQDKYGDKVKVLLSDWNEGCEGGCVLYVYIL